MSSATVNAQLLYWKRSRAGCFPESFISKALHFASKRAYLHTNSVNSLVVIQPIHYPCAEIADIACFRLDKKIYNELLS